MCVDVAWIDLADGLPAASARRQRVGGSVMITPDGNDLRDSVLTGGDHGGDGCVLGTVAGAGPGVDAHALKNWLPWSVTSAAATLPNRRSPITWGLNQVAAAVMRSSFVVTSPS